VISKIIKNLLFKVIKKTFLYIPHINLELMAFFFGKGLLSDLFNKTLPVNFRVYLDDAFHYDVKDHVDL
jgi:hypothetical protein